MSKPKGDELWRWQHGQTAHSGPDLAMERLAFTDIEGWASDNHGEALRTYANTARLLDGAPMPTEVDFAAPKQFFETHFTPWRYVCEPGLLTAYYEPLLQGSRTPSSLYHVPLYRRPADLVPLPAGHLLLQQGLTGGRQTQTGDYEPYATRAEIENGALRDQGLELLYVNDAVAAFFMHVQGSGLIALDDGTHVRLTFDGKNGHPYASIGKLMVARRLISLEDATLDGIVTYLHAHPDQAASLLQENKSYIFFKPLESSAQGPQGSSGAALQKGRSLAADPRFNPLGSPVWVMASELDYDGAPLARLMIAQDTGSAIVGAKRGDLFAGSGSQAGSLAGRTRHVCDFILLKPRT